MKRILLALATVALLLPATRQAEAAGDVSVDFFYNNLNDGNWVEVADYGYCWQPNVASNADWRPYADGYWAYTDVGWTWVSNEDFGWATYHYGRWARLQNEGWVWVPGYEWGPAWVSWRTGGDYIGWAPLPPSAERVYEGRAITGHVDVEFDIGPAYYNFVDIRYIGEPALRNRIVDRSQNITYINQTVNVTNITYNNSRVYNHGPDYDRLSRYSTRPIQRLTLERNTNVNFSAGVRGREVTRIQGDKLVVAAPLTIQKSASKKFAPKKVKTKIEQPKVEHGWSGVSDPKVKAEMQKKMKAEDAKAVPTPKMQPNEKAAPGTAGGASPSAAPSAAPAMSPAASPENVKSQGGKDKKANTTPSTSPVPTAKKVQSPAPTPLGRAQGKGNKKPNASQTPASANGPAPAPQQRRGEQERNLKTPTPPRSNGAQKKAENSGRKADRELNSSKAKTTPNEPSGKVETQKASRKRSPEGQTVRQPNVKSAPHNVPPATEQGRGQKEKSQPKKKGGATPEPTPR